MKKTHNSGDDIAGIVESVGEGVYEFKKGDRVAAFHEMMKPHGSFAEYAIAWDYATFHLPQGISFEEVSRQRMVEVWLLTGLRQQRYPWLLTQQLSDYTVT